jgi:uncharacterized protein DUF3306
MTARENFVSRWARLKRDADVVRAREQAADPRPLAAGEPRSEGSADQPFDLASLPSIESITASSDISGFLRSGVPAELARAALRRVWTSDPAIRDFVGIAENQWDFNDPNAIPGFGALPGGENSPNLLAQALGNHDRLAGMIPETPAFAAPSLPAAIDRKPVALDQNAPQASGVSPSIENISHSPDDAGNVQVAEADVAPRPRSHGGALPR